MCGLHVVRRIAAKNAQIARGSAQFLKRFLRLCVTERHLQIEVEAVLPGLAGNWAAFDFQQIDAAPREDIERALERSGLVFEMHHEGKLVGMRDGLRSWREQEEACEIFAMIFEVLAKNAPAVDLRGAPACNGSPRRIPGAHHIANASSGIERGHAADPRMRAEERFALRQRNRMRFH